LKQSTNFLALTNICGLFLLKPQHKLSNFNLPKNLGPSGCGKSTIISLLERFYDTQQGQIRLDETRIQDMNLTHLRTQMALVGQEPVLFNLTLKENIAYGLDEMNLEEVIEAAKQANIHDFIRSLPKVSFRY
jgi:ATP-binding cassette subfamily B (MDR/TAP) protein 1